MKNNFGISDNSMKLIVQTIESFKDVERVVLFGSRAMGNYKKGSDIDLAIYGSKLKEHTPMSLSAKLNEVVPIPYQIDVVAPEFIKNDNLKEHIERVGIVLLF